MKLCIHCIHHSTTSDSEHTCTHEELAPLSPVTGELVTAFCETLRSKGKCGELGQLFEGKPGHEEDE